MDLLTNLGVLFFLLGFSGVLLAGWVGYYWLERQRLQKDSARGVVFGDDAGGESLPGWVSWLAVVAPPATWAVTGSLALGVMMLALAIVIPKMVIASVRKSYLKKFEHQLPDALLMMAGAVRSGASLQIALENVVKDSRPPFSQEFSLFLRDQRLGMDFDKALRNMELRLPLVDFQLVSAAIRIAREVGGNLAEVLEGLSATLRDKHMMEGKITSLTSQGRMQGVVMTGLPILLTFVLYKMEPQSMGLLFTTPAGWGTLAVIVVMELLGFFFISKIVAIDV